MAHPIPRPVMMFPSRTAGSRATMAPSSCSSNPGKAVALFPFKIPLCPKMDGAAQIAHTALPDAANLSTCSIKGPQASRFLVPGIPPGSTSISTCPKSTSSSSLSITTGISWEPVTVRSPVTDTISVSIPCLRKRSTTVSASISS
ncbi:hypothetical protein IMSAGC019_02907 [Lachnospiraceae bacterium]|nr:hypothetical protein IMSAGC019_02907 [Lachnospiraceae bacterium]